MQRRAAAGLQAYLPVYGLFPRYEPVQLGVKGLAAFRHDKKDQRFAP
jgi:hypothetical protein